MLRFSVAVRTRTPLAPLVQLVLGLSLAACSGSDDGSTSTSGDTGTHGSDSATTDVATDTQTSTDSTASDTTTTDTALAPDADATSIAVGKPCVDGSSCSTDFCITDSRFKGGYCSEPITECPAPGGGPDPCPLGSSCVNGLGFAAGGASDFCLLVCTTDSDCRVGEGYACCPGLGHSGEKVCAPSSYCPSVVDAGP